VTVIAAEMPWSGQRCFRDRAYPSYLFEHAVVDVARDEAGQLHLDYRKMDRLLDLAAFNARLAFVEAAAPGFKYSVAINHFEFVEGAPPEVVDAVPVLPLACQDPELTAALTGRLHARGGRMLWYVCCWPPIPNTFIHSPLVEGQLHGWLTYYLKLDGFLRWNFCLWPAEPWKRVSWRAPVPSAILPGSERPRQRRCTRWTPGTTRPPVAWSWRP